MKNKNKSQSGSETDGYHPPQKPTFGRPKPQPIKRPQVKRPQIRRPQHYG